jgi:hypothetical protein
MEAIRQLESVNTENFLSRFALLAQVCNSNYARAALPLSSAAHRLFFLHHVVGSRQRLQM